MIRRALGFIVAFVAVAILAHIIISASGNVTGTLRVFNAITETKGK